MQFTAWLAQCAVQELLYLKSVLGREFVFAFASCRVGAARVPGHMCQPRACSSHAVSLARRLASLKAGFDLSQTQRPVQAESGFAAWSAREASRVAGDVQMPPPRAPSPDVVIDLTASPVSSPVPSVQDSDDGIFFLGTLDPRNAQSQRGRPAAPPAAEVPRRTGSQSPAGIPVTLPEAEPVASGSALTGHASLALLGEARVRLSHAGNRVQSHVLHTAQGPRQQGLVQARRAAEERAGGPSRLPGKCS